MAPPAKKRTRTARNSPPATQAAPSALLADHRTAWLVNSDDRAVELKARGETFKVSKAVLVKHSEYFETCLNGQFKEADKGAVEFDGEVDPKYLALYIGVSYSHSTLVPHDSPTFAEYPEACTPNTPLKDFIEVYKLCDRFLSHKMREFMAKCIKKYIGDGHRALFRTDKDHFMQKYLMREFADGFEALDLRDKLQREMGVTLISYFCEGISYMSWANDSEEVSDRPRFVANVSRRFALQLAELQISRKAMKRKELKGPN
ncbi:Fc.00g070460.m01.CDS01 [Cosmosporella sp. VM-42]